MRKAAIVVALMVGGCATTTGILPAGPDTYTLTERVAPVRGGGDAAEADALQKANQFCAEKNLVFVPNNMGNAAGPPNPYGPTGYTVTFKCLPQSDPAVANYQLQPAPNVIVEQRNR